MLDIDTQSFLQVLMTKGVMSQEDVAREIVFIFGDNIVEGQIQMINEKIAPYNFVIKSANCELSGMKYWIFTANVMDKVMNYPGRFTRVQLEYVRKVFSEIINSEEGYISTITCINVRSQMTGQLSATEAESTLTMMIDQMWVHQQGDNVYMGVRSVGELMPYFRESYADGLNACLMCRNTIFHGYRCENCQGVSHLYCIAKAVKYQKNLKCLGCAAPVRAQNLPEIHEDDSMDLDEDDVSSVRNPKTSKARKSQRRR
ncbi:non-structural maintenance of chromosomes element 1 homolog [Fopius arisanus]|uniref:Non-structural maintenance of chromosomes element 1 homolog n=1 Tax=Fopius arisanus TaxID=64838 RepID=A0A9R1T9X1_9HYME|nr:PREDICTED: non-structural maintenance of chromosomes element 1 homolog [Fopius arisanus]